MGEDILVPKGGMLITCGHKPCSYQFAALLKEEDGKCYCPKCNKEVILSMFAIRFLNENNQYIGRIMEDGLSKENTNETGQVIEFDENGIISVVKVEDKKPFNQLIKSDFNKDV